MNMPVSLAEYLDLAQLVRQQWDPDPFKTHPGGDWHGIHFEEVLVAVMELLRRFDAGEVPEAHLLGGKDNGPKKRDTLSYWLYYQHHPGSEYWKLMGQRYWSVSAWRAWRAWRDAGGRSFPKRKRSGDSGLVSEHVVPKKVMKERICADRANVRLWLQRNLCCVVTVAEDGHLVRDTHPDAADPWLRYEGKGIVLLHNSAWNVEEIDTLLRHGMLDRSSVAPS
jgi:hypothetical protein